MNEHDKVKVYVRVRTFFNDQLEQERVIDHNNRDDRIWLGRHCFWAFRNERKIITEAKRHKALSGDDNEQ